MNLEKSFSWSPSPCCPIKDGIMSLQNHTLGVVTGMKWFGLTGTMGVTWLPFAPDFLGPPAAVLRRQGSCLVGSGQRLWKRWFHPMLSSWWHLRVTRLEERTCIFVIHNFHSWRPQHSREGQGRRELRDIMAPPRLSSVACDKGRYLGPTFLFSLT